MNKMKTKTYVIAALLLLTGAVSCDTDLITETGGLLPDEAAIGKVGSTMSSGLSFSGRGEVTLTVGEEGDEPQTVLADQLIYTLSQPAQSETKATLSLGTELTKEFLAEVERENVRLTAFNKIMMNINPIGIVSLFGSALFPARNVQLETNSLAVPVGKTASQTISLSLSNKGLATDTLYLLPIIVKQTDGKGNTRTQLLQYLVKPYSKSMNMYLNYGQVWNPGVLGIEFMTVFYVNTETYQPLVVDTWKYNKMNNTTFQIEHSRALGNIVNLKPAAVGYDAAANHALFNLGPDLRYVLEHADKYIRPLQNRGRKVCICINGGGKGLGFCNMNDEQIADFTAQVKEVVEHYRLDGINLWDEGSKYGKEGMPAMNTTSYPKLIKALRQALPGKLLTLVDKDQSTEYFYDAAKCGGIEVGKLIDYAWSGYNDEMEAVQIVEPWANDHPYSEVIRKPIAGLTPERYGSINVPRYGFNTPFEITQTTSPKRVIDWRTAGRKRNDILIFGADLTSNEQGLYESQPMWGQFSYLGYVADGGNIWGQDPWSGEWGVQMGNYYYMLEGPSIQYKHLMKDW